jgi:ParB family chromosome partitioning protein
VQNTRRILEDIAANVEESMGVRQHEAEPKSRPISPEKDASRSPLRNFGSVDVDQVLPDPNQPRVKFSEQSLNRLAKSIQERGQLTAIRVRWSEEAKKWVIIAGERRWRAAKRAGLATIDCYFHEGVLSKSEILEQQLIENCLRQDLQPIEEANAFSTLMRLNNWNAKQLAETLRLAPCRITRALALLRLPDDIQDHVAAGKISARAGYELSKLKDESSQRELAQRAASGLLTHEQAAKAVRQRKGKPTRRRQAIRQTFLADGGWRIVVLGSKNGTYDDIAQALLAALDEVRHRIRNRVQLF